MRGPQTGSKGLSPSETSRLLMANDSDSDSDNLVIDMGSKPTIDPKTGRVELKFLIARKPAGSEKRLNQRLRASLLRFSNSEKKDLEQFRINAKGLVFLIAALNSNKWSFVRVVFQRITKS